MFLLASVKARVDLRRRHGPQVGLYFKAIEAYGTTTREAIARFRDHKLGFANCIAPLDAALADLIPRLTSEQLVHLRAVMLANNEIVMKEMERRWPTRENSN